MATLDVSEVLDDGDISSTFTVLRRTETVNGSGRAIIVENRIQNVVGVITSAGKNDLDRLPEEQRMGRNLVVVTKFRLRGPADGYQPDVVLWYGNEFVVKNLDPYPQYGPGFMQAIVGSMDIIDSAILPPAPDVGRLDFSNQSNSGLIPLGVM